MKNFLIQNKNLILFIFLSFFAWLAFLNFIQNISFFASIHNGFINSNPWANFDGTHYISIGKINYVWQEQAFFPLFPMLIHVVGGFFFRQSYVPAGIIIPLICLPVMLFVFAKLIQLDFSKRVSFWTIIFLLVFPTAFFLRAAYTESLFLLLTISSFYFARKKQFILAALLAGFASATRIVGIFIFPALIIEFLLINNWKIKWSFSSVLSLASIILLAPLGLLSYMFFLWKQYNDPLLFFHNLSIYGEQRSASKIILLPQVLFRYFKILTTVPFSSYNFQIALLELCVFLFVAILLILFWKKIRLSYLIYGIGALLLPTLSGSLSSFPRYALVIFPIFMILGTIKNSLIKGALCVMLLTLESLLCMLFLRGYFIS